MYFDSHGHYDDPRFDADRHALLARLPQHGVCGVLNVGSDLAASEASLALAEAYPFVYAAVGVHPHDVKGMTEADLEALRRLSQHAKNVAIGEIGLDFHYEHTPQDEQRHWFARQLALAREVQLPVVLHSREAAADTLRLLKASGLCAGVLHCYSGSLEMALEYIDMGFHIGIGGTVTFKNARKVREVAAGIPLSRILLETDAPYLAPEPHRGQRNDATHLPLIAAAVAQARGISAAEVAEATTENARRLFVSVK